MTKEQRQFNREKIGFLINGIGTKYKNNENLTYFSHLTQKLTQMDHRPKCKI